jgi:hypothetical protein
MAVNPPQVVGPAFLAYPNPIHLKKQFMENKPSHISSPNWSMQKQQLVHALFP